MNYFCNCIFSLELFQNITSIKYHSCKGIKKDCLFHFFVRRCDLFLLAEMWKMTQIPCGRVFQRWLDVKKFCFNGKLTWKKIYYLPILMEKGDKWLMVSVSISNLSDLEIVKREQKQSEPWNKFHGSLSVLVFCILLQWCNFNSFWFFTCIYNSKVNSFS